MTCRPREAGGRSRTPPRTWAGTVGVSAEAAPASGARAAGAAPVGYSAPDSTLFFSPARARSMMTFSALRLIMPSMGILTSTVSW